ncbi:MAG: exodeoxyribonuclease III [Geminicoccaceae bacterium]|nr:exodeoxyribonuclease III [Geminicoccaceae bacterium]
MRLRITTWNANSIRLRAKALRRIVEEIRPDVLCLQETKVEDAKFPHDLVSALGFPYRWVHGQKAYHGVAILSKLPIEEPRAMKWCGVEDCRHALCRLPGGIELHDLYIPAGGDVPDPETNPKFAHKLAMVRELTRWFAARKGDGAKLVLLGDLNIAPLENDVWSHKQLLDVVSHTPVETEALAAMQEAYGFTDAVRTVIPPEKKLYTWWSYRARDWSASDRGRRLDHIWLSPALAPTLVAAEVRRDARGWEDPSDHVPVTVELDL